MVRLLDVMDISLGVEGKHLSTPANLKKKKKIKLSLSIPDKDSTQKIQNPVQIEKCWEDKNGRQREVTRIV